MNHSPDLFATSLKMLAALGIVLGGLLILLFIAKRFVKKDAAGTHGKLIRVLASQYIGWKKNISLVEVPGAILVVGISNDHICLLTKIDDPAILDGFRHQQQNHLSSFSEHLNKFTARFKAAKPDP